MTEITADHSAGAGTHRTLASECRRAHAQTQCGRETFPDDGPCGRCIRHYRACRVDGSILSNGLSSFSQTYIALDVYLDPAKLDKNGNRAPEDMQKITTFTIQPLIKTAMQDMLDEAWICGRRRQPEGSGCAHFGEAPADLRRFVLANPDQIGETVSFDLLASGRIDGYFKGRVTMESAALDRNISPEQLVLADRLKEAGVLDLRFNWAFFTAPDASDTRPEAAGLGVAILGSAYMMVIVLALSLPIGVAASIYLEEFAPQNRWTDLIEVNIANLAAVPSIVFGILGLALFINFVGLPQSAPIVGALVLTLDDPAHHHHCHPRRPQGGSAIDP
jgi:phosphate transport system permease protein